MRSLASSAGALEDSAGASDEPAVSVFLVLVVVVVVVVVDELVVPEDSEPVEAPDDSELDEPEP